MRIGSALNQLFDRKFFPATKDELLDYAIRNGANAQVIEHIEGLLDNENYESVDDMLEIEEDVSDFFNNEDY